MEKKSIITIIVVAIIVGTLAFYGGMVYGQGKTKTAATSAATGAAGGAGGFAGRARGAGGAGGFGGGATGGGLITGQILSQDSSSITIKLPNNTGSKIIYYSSSTQVSKPTIVPVSALSTGDTIIVTGTTNSDGTVSAQNIQVRPAPQATSTPSSATPTQGQ